MVIMVVRIVGFKLGHALIISERSGLITGVLAGWLLMSFPVSIGPDAAACFAGCDSGVTACESWKPEFTQLDRGLVTCPISPSRSSLAA